MDMTHVSPPSFDDPYLGANPFDAGYQQDPFPALAALRAFAPVSQLPSGGYRLTRYRDCRRLLRDVPTRMRFADGSLRGQELIPPEITFPDFMLQRDPPDHTRLRRLVSKAFTPAAVASLREKVQAITDGLVDRALARGELDVVADLALPVPSAVICEMMGVPLADRARFTGWTSDATQLLGAGIVPQEDLDRGIAGAVHLGLYFTDLIEARRGKHRGDILSDLIHAQEEGSRLSHGELLSQAIGLLIAGFETTVGLIGNGILQLTRHPDQLAALRANPSLIGTAVEECLRYDGPIELTMRVLCEETRFGDSVIPADSEVMAVLISANRDGDQFPQPDSFDIARTPNEHLAFGGGIHMCLGAHLARMEAQVAIGTLVRRTAAIEVTDTPRSGRSMFRVLDRLPVRVVPAMDG